MKIRIIGDGTVGKALAKNMKLVAEGPSNEPIEADIVIICVPTPTNKKQDLSALRQVLRRIKEAKLVIIRSTILPGTTDSLQAKCTFPLVFIPEFGSEDTMVEDLKKPKYYLVGTTELSINIVRRYLKILPKAKFYYMPAIAAEFSKYFTNIWGCSQIILANTLYDWVIKKTGDENIYYQAVDGAVVKPNVPSWGWNIYDKGFRGAGGKCLPKDLKAAIGDFPNEFLKTIDKINDNYVK